MDEDEAVDRPVWAVVLAAGRSSRYGSSKLLESYQGETLIARALRSANTATHGRVLLVTGHDANRIAAAAALARETVFNPNYARGIGSSIACAAGHLSRRAGALLITLADQPLVTTGHLRRLIETWDGSDTAIVATAYGGDHGVPALLPKGTFRELVTFDDDRGARRLFVDTRFRVTAVQHAAASIDIDTPADLERLHARE